MSGSLGFAGTASLAQRFAPDERYYIAFSVLYSPRSVPCSSVKALLCDLDNTVCGIQGTVHPHGQHNMLSDMLYKSDTSRHVSAYLCQKSQWLQEMSLHIWSTVSGGRKRNRQSSSNCLSLAPCFCRLPGEQGYSLFTRGNYSHAMQPSSYYTILFARSESGSIEGEVCY